MTMHAQLEDRLSQLEYAWRGSEQPDLARFWLSVQTEVSGTERTDWLHEIIKIDLEYRWSKLHGFQGMLDAYAGVFPELGPVITWPLDLIVEEWRNRLRWGDRPTLNEYLARFPGKPGLESALTTASKVLIQEWRNSSETTPLKEVVPECDPRATLDYREFVLMELIGSGGMGKVYRARKKSDGNFVAVKMLRKSYWKQQGAIDRFLEEARVVTRLRHPGIVGVEGVGQTPAGGLFIVMDLIDGPNLQEVIEKQPVSPCQAIAWIAEVASALDHAHRQGIVHCDLKPSNLLMERTGRILLSDFGLAIALVKSDAPRRWAGTLGFMAPEQLDGAFGDISPATDIFALGLILHRLLTGQPVFCGKSILKILSKWAQGDLDPFGINMDRNIFPEIGEVLAACLKIEPNARIQAAATVAEVLQKNVRHSRKEPSV